MSDGDFAQGEVERCEMCDLSAGAWRSVLRGGEASVNDGWVFVATTYDQNRGESIMYVGLPGQALQESRYVDSFPFVSQGRASLQLGGIDSSFERLNGRMDNTFVFEGALNKSQIEDIWNASDPAATAQSIGAQIAASHNRKWKIDIQGTGFPATGINGKTTWNVLDPFLTPTLTDLKDTSAVTTGAQRLRDQRCAHCV